MSSIFNIVRPGRLHQKRPDFDPWNSRPYEMEELHPLGNQHHTAVQTDFDLRCLPTLPNEKATMTERFGSHNSFRAPSPPRRAQTPGPERVGGYDQPVLVPYNTYYQRLARSSVEPLHLRRKYRQADSAPPTFKAGRMGAPWRHIKQCTGSMGNHICFIDGTVKEEDTRRYPPYGHVNTARPDVTDKEGCMVLIPNRHRSAISRNQFDNKLNTYYNNHAKNGFRYWFEEKQPPKLRPNLTIQGRLMKATTGY